MRARDDSHALLGSLEERDLIRREAVSRIQGDQQFAFKHALIQDVAYQRLPRAARRERHAVVARFLEEATGGVGQRTRRSRTTGARRASRAGGRAPPRRAEQAGRGWAKEHAVALYREALELVPEDDAQRRREIMRRLAVALQAPFHLADAERLRQRAIARATSRDRR